MRQQCPILAVLVTAVVAMASVTAQCSTQWSAMGSGMDSSVAALASLPNGDLVAGGGFTTAGGASANHIARWDGSAWSPLGLGVNAPVRALTSLANGDVVAVGDFTMAGGVSANGIARWDGMSWSALGSGIVPPVTAVATLPNGDIVAGGTFSSAGGVSANRIARWDGTNWSPLGSGMGGISSVHALTVLANGDLVAGGGFTMAGGAAANHIARWNGASWFGLGSGIANNVTVPFVLALTTLPNGDVVAGGDFRVAGGVNCRSIARWNGTSWSPLGSGIWGLVWAVTTLSNGDIIAGGLFNSAGGVSAVCIARWDGISWSALGSGMGGNGPTTLALSTLANGAVAAGGNFTTAGGVSSNYIADLTTTCPAVVTSSGGGCSGTAGPNVLAASNLPWTGSTFRARANGLTNNSLAISLRGLTTQSVALTTLLPQGVVGCTLDVSTEGVLLLVPSGGRVDTQLVIPNSMTFAGVVLHHQVLAAELDAQNSIIAVTSTNALRLLIGTF